jgi:hypothetical protein
MEPSEEGNPQLSALPAKMQDRESSPQRLAYLAFNSDFGY